ncbi:type III pantothenate kinase [Colwelliaceae bacterium 6441]
MKLLLDIGNSYCKYATSTNSKISPVKRIDIQQISEQWLQESFSSVKQCLISNVNQRQINDIIVAWCKNRKIPHHIIQSEDNKFKIQCAYNNPSTFGVDRWLGLLGAAKLFPNQAALIVDLGTATTVDLLLATGKHCGGWILPGIDLIFSSVVNHTNKVSAHLETVEHLSFADNTSTAVNQASWAATLGYIETAIRCAKNNNLEINETLTLILTGGNAKKMSHLLHNDHELIENLIFVGIDCYEADKKIHFE